MKNIRKKILLALNLFGLFMFFFSYLNVHAEGLYQAIDSSPDTWITQKEETYDETTGEYTTYYYKMTVPKNVCVAVKTENQENVYVYKRMGDTDPEVITWREEKFLPKGVYYIHGGKFRYTFKPYKNESNYKLSKAKTLKAGKETVIVQTLGKDYSRWYKIELKKNQSITYWIPWLTGVYIYNSKLQRIRDISSGEEDINTGKVKYYTARRQKKGVYYIRICRSRKTQTYGKDNKDFHKVVTLKWK